MHFFISQIKNAVVIKEADQVKIQLSEALKKVVLKWYMNKLDDNIQLLIKISDEIIIWYLKLTKWFHENFFIIMNKIIKKKFTLQNIYNNHASTDYMSNIFYHKQFIDLFHVSMIRLAWQNLAIKFHSTINLSEFDDIIQKTLIQKFEVKQYIWQELTNHIFWQYSKNIYNKTVITKQA